MQEIQPSEDLLVGYESATGEVIDYEQPLTISSIEPDRFKLNPDVELFTGLEDKQEFVLNKDQLINDLKSSNYNEEHKKHLTSLFIADKLNAGYDDLNYESLTRSYFGLNPDSKINTNDVYENIQKHVIPEEDEDYNKYVEFLNLSQEDKLE